MKSSKDDIHLIAGLKTGRESALNALFDQFYQALCYYAIKMINDQSEAEDIVTDTFSKLWNRKEDFETMQHVKGFLYISTRNACLDHLRQKQRNRTAQKELSYLLTSEEEEGLVAEQIRTEVLRKIYEEIEKLPKQCRQVFELSVFEGLKSKDIAKRMDITVSNVTSQKSRAVHLLRTAVLKRIIAWILWLG
jgi:RNA polymerase sigma-70 factor (family 1)